MPCDLEVTNSIDCARRNLAFAKTMKLKVNIILKEILYNVCPTTLLVCPTEMMAWSLFLESPNTFSGPESSFVFVVFAFNENNTMKLSVNEAILTGLWARNCATIQ